MLFTNSIFKKKFMKKIIFSFTIIAAAAALIIGATSAYFSDTETSNGNTFTAGKLDLMIDVDGNIYNPLEGPLFTASDVKPGDKGEETISIHVDDNPSCGSVAINLTDDSDNGCTEPEEQEEADCATDPDGELNDNLTFAIWNDEGNIEGWQGKEGDPEEGDNILNGKFEKILTNGTFTESKVYAFGEIDPKLTYYYGVEWGLDSNVGNEVQSDTFSGDIIFKADQKRNQYPGGCPIGDITPIK